MEVDSDHEGEQVHTLDVPIEEKEIMEESTAGPSRKRKRSSRSEDRRPHSKPPATSPSTQVDEKERRERLRDLSRQAYAPESLHTFKADPLHRHRGHTHSAQRGRGFGAGGSSRSGGGGERGQPNMKLRMNALLEKIKLDAGVA